MLRSLRFRLPALFLLGIALAAVVAALIAIRFFQDYTRTHAAHELRAESAGIVELYARQAGIGDVPAESLHRAIGGDDIFWVPAVPGASLLSGSVHVLARSAVPFAELVGNGGPETFNLNADGQGYLAVGQSVELAGIPAGVIVVA